MSRWSIAKIRRQHSRSSLNLAGGAQKDAQKELAESLVCGPDRGLKALKSDEDQYLELPLKVRLLAICICGSTTNLTNPFNAPIAAPY